jgi:hypothetical protein
MRKLYKIRIEADDELSFMLTYEERVMVRI